MNKMIVVGGLLLALLVPSAFAGSQRTQATVLCVELHGNADTRYDVKRRPGSKCARGEDKVKLPAGAQGPGGPQGPAGPAGPSGAKGDPGAPGPAGATGSQGPTGGPVQPVQPEPQGRPAQPALPGPLDSAFPTWS